VKKLKKPTSDRYSSLRKTHATHAGRVAPDRANSETPLTLNFGQGHVQGLYVNKQGAPFAQPVRACTASTNSVSAAARTFTRSAFNRIFLSPFVPLPR
jgi:hypothetical protein